MHYSSVGRAAGRSPRVTATVAAPQPARPRGLSGSLPPAGVAGHSRAVRKEEHPIFRPRLPGVSAPLALLPQEPAPALELSARAQR